MLNLYRRHYDNDRCIGGHRPNTQTYESDELRPKHKKCGCPIYASGKLGENPKFRRNTQCVHWSEAKAVAERWERSGVEAPPPDPAPPTSPSGRPRRTIADAAKITQEQCKEEGGTLATVRRYRCFLKKICTFSSDVKGYVYLDQWTTEDIAELRVWWKGSLRYKGKYTGFVRGFFDEHRKFIAENPVDPPKRPRNRKQIAAAQDNEKSPYTDAELNRMLAACERYPDTGLPQQKFFGEDLADFIQISAYTGLRISDMAVFHLDRMTPEGDVHFRAIKNDKWVDTWVPEFIQEIIRKRAEKWGPYIFGARRSEDPAVLGKVWRERLNLLWSLCEPFGETPTHHRFRHTFVRILLEDGTPVSVVASLLGDTEDVVRQYYSKWVRERQDQVRRVLRSSFGKKARLFAVK